MTMIATFGTALDITLAELSLETFLPADAATAAALFARSISPQTRPDRPCTGRPVGDTLPFSRRRVRGPYGIAE